MPDIYLCFTGVDRRIAGYVADELQKRGAATTSASLENASHFLLIYSPRAAADPQIKTEIITALLQDKRISVLTVEPSPLTLPDFPFLLDDATVQFNLTNPEEAETALDALAAHYGLSQQPVTLPDASLFDFNLRFEDDQESRDVHTSENTPSITQAALDHLLFVASELSEARFGAALMLLLWLPRFAGDYMSTIRGYRDQQLTNLRSRWLQQIEKQAQAALDSNNNAQLEALVQTLHVLDPQHPLSWKLQGSLRERRVTTLWQQLKAKADRDGWTMVGALLDELRAVSPLDQRTLQAAERYRNELECQALSEVAERAATGSYNRAFAHLMEYIQKRCPDFEDTRALLKDLQLTAELVEYLKPRHVLRGGGGVQSLAFAPDDTLLVSGGTDGVLRLWDMEQKQQVARQSRDDGGILSLVYSPDGMLLVSASEAGVVRLWQMPEGREVMTIDEFSDRIACVCFTPEGQGLICGGTSGTVQIIRIEDGLVLYDTHAPSGDAVEPIPASDRHHYAITSLSLSRTDDGQTLLLTASDDKTVKLWRLEEPLSLTLLHSLKQHTMIVREAVFSQTDPRLAVSVGNDGLICIWSVETGELLKTLRSTTANQVRAAAFVPGKLLLATAGTDQKVTLWDVDSAQPLHQLHHHEGSINALAFSQDGLWLASGSSDQRIVLWHL
jgi:WD40 repeat protein